MTEQPDARALARTLCEEVLADRYGPSTHRPEPCVRCMSFALAIRTALDAKREEVLVEVANYFEHRRHPILAAEVRALSSHVSGVQGA